MKPFGSKWLDPCRYQRKAGWWQSLRCFIDRQMSKKWNEIVRIYSLLYMYMHQRAWILQSCPVAHLLINLTSHERTLNIITLLNTLQELFSWNSSEACNLFVVSCGLFGLFVASCHLCSCPTAECVAPQRLLSSGPRSTGANDAPMDRAAGLWPICKLSFYF